MFQSRGSAPSWPTTKTTRSCIRLLLLLTSSIDKRAPDLAQSGKKKWRKHLQLTKTPIHPSTHLYKKIPGTHRRKKKTTTTAEAASHLPPSPRRRRRRQRSSAAARAAQLSPALTNGRTDEEGIGTDTAKETKITTSEADEMGGCGGGGAGEAREGRKKGEADNAQIDTANRRFGR